LNLYIRLIYTILHYWWQGRADPRKPMQLTFRVWPHDLDLNLHLNNGRYLTLMDLGRMQLLTRAGVIATVFKNKWMPLLGGAHIEYKKPLAPFRAFTLTTRVATWDKKWIYIEQQFHAAGELMAVAHVKALIRGRKGNIPSAEFLKISGWEGDPPEPVPTFYSEGK